MERRAMERLVKWKDSPNRKPLILRGLRQTGKTWLAEEFGKRYYDSMVIANLENRKLHSAFANVTEPEDIVRSLSLLLGHRIEETTLIFLDEVQECPDALASLKYFCEKTPRYHVIAAGSLLGVSFGQGRRFPVGKVDQITLCPMDFREFLTATGNEGLAEVIESYDKNIIPLVSGRLTELLRTYMCVGGMPEAVRTYVETGDLLQVRDVQMRMLDAFGSDMSNHPPSRIIQRMKEVWNSIPYQLSKENGRKFVYALLGKGGASRYLESVQWLVEYGLLIMVKRAEKPACPLSSVSDGKAYKLFVADVGLLGAKAGLDPSLVLFGDSMFTEFRGSMTEQFVLQELISIGYEPYYWSSERNEVDFLIEHRGAPIPIEVKASVNLMSKSLKAFRDRYGTEVCVRTSLTGTKDEGWLVNVPLYAISSIGKALDERVQPSD